MRPLRIAIIRQKYNPFGGAERFVTRALGALQASGAELTLLSRQWKNQDNLFHVKPIQPFYIGSLWREISFSRAVQRHLAQHSDYDLIQSHERIAGCAVYRAGDGVHAEWLEQRARTLPFLQKCGLLVNLFHRYLCYTERKMFQHSELKKVICNSKMVQDEIKQRFQLPDDKLALIYSGVDLDLFHPQVKKQRHAIRSQLGIPESARVFLMVGSGFARKGVPQLLQAMRNLPAETRLIIVGTDKHLARYTAECKQDSHLVNRVYFVGGQQDVTPYYGAADGFVLPTLYDPFPNAILEAFACGLPVITSRKSGGAEMVQESKNGFVIDALDIDALRNAMLHLVNLPINELQQWQVDARQTVLPYSLASMAENLHLLYASLLPSLPTSPFSKKG